MPWKLRKQIILIILGCAAIVLGSIILLTRTTRNIELLAIVAIVGGFAIIVNSLPTNGGTP